jgi:PBSX family phage terminase large subunit
VLDEIELIFDTPITLDKNNSFIFMDNRFYCFGSKDADDYKTIKGFTAFGWYGNEITDTHMLTLDQCRYRCSGAGARIFWDCNPDHPMHNVKINYIDKADGKRIKSWHFILEDNAKINNGFLTDEYIENIKVTTPKGHSYDRNILGLWVAAEGMIYKTFNPDLHFIDDIDRSRIKTFFCGLDWGFSHLGVVVLCGIDSSGNYYLLKEFAEYGKGMEYWVNIVKGINKDYGHINYYCDPSRQDNIYFLKQAGIHAMDAENSVLPGITFINELFQKNTLKIVRKDVKYFNDNIYNYLWKEGMREEPIKTNDDVMDALRYAIYTFAKNNRIIKTPSFSAAKLGL